MPFVFVNNFSRALASAITDSATSIIITDATGLPTLGAGEYYYLTISTGVTFEIVKVTARTTTTLTVVRAQESTTARAWPLGTPIEMRITAEYLNGRQDELSAASLTTVTPVSGDLILLQDASDSYNLKVANFSSFGGGGGSGDVVGPASAVGNSIVLFDSTTGKLIKNMAAAPGADRLLFWDDSASSTAYLTLGTNLSITGTTLNATGGSGSQTPWTATIDTAGYELTNTSTADGVEIVGSGAGTFITGTTLSIQQAAGNANATNIFLYEGPTNGSNYTNLNARDNLTASTNFTLPPDNGSTNYVLITDGSGNTSWAAPSASGTVNTGSINQLAYYAAGGTAVSGLATINNGVLVTNGSGVPSIATTLPTGLALATPASVTLTNATGLPISTGVSGLGTGVATFLATPSSANLATAVTDETGSGALVFATSPTLVTPILGTPASGTLTNCTGLPAQGQLFRGFRASYNGNQSMATGTNTKITLSTEEYDTGGEYDPTTNYRHTPTVAGKWMYMASGSIVSLADGKALNVKIYKNGAAVQESKYMVSASASTWGQSVTVLDMNGTTDYVELYLSHDHGSSRTTDAFASVNWLAGTFIGT